MNAPRSMSAGFFGSYFRRKMKEAQDEGADSKPSAPDATPSPQGHGEAPAGSPEPPRLSSLSNFIDDDVNPTPAAASPASPGSPLATLMQDELMMGLVQHGIVTTEQALVALQHQKAHHPNIPLWRIAASLDGVDTTAMYEAAARLMGYLSVEVTKDTPTPDFVSAVLGLIPPAHASLLLKMALLPFEFVMDPERKQHTLVLATPDPSHPKVQTFANQLGMEVELRYAAPDAVKRHIARAQTAMQAAQAAPPAPKPELEPEPEPEPAPPPPKAIDLTALHRALDELDSIGDEEEWEETEAQEVSGDILASTDDAFPSPTAALPPDLGLGGSGLAPDADPDVDILVEPGLAGEALDSFIGDGHLDGDLPEARLGDPADAGADPSLGAASGTPGAGEPPKGGGGTPSGNGEKPTPPASDTDVIVTEEEVRLMAKDRVVAMLLRKEVITPQQAKRAWQSQQDDDSKEALWRLVADLADVDSEEVFAEAARVYAFKTAQTGDGKPDPEFARSVMDTFPEDCQEDLLKMRVIPMECDLETKTGAIKLVFITHDPMRPEVNKIMQRLKLERFELQYAPEGLMNALIAEAFPKRNEFLERMREGGMAYDLGTSYDESGNNLIDEGALEAEISSSKLLNLFEATLVEAVRQGASDVHIYPNAQKKVEIHFRVDGRLTCWHREDKVHPEALLAVIKDNTINVDRFERDAAQDGFIQRWIDDTLIRFRVSVLPIANAIQEMRSESIVIRVLDDRKVITDLTKLGLLDSALDRFDKAIRQPHGMVILTGPTGSGKSTTLVAALHQVVSPEVNVLTVEDPVEYIIPGVRQIKLNTKLDLEDALRAILRHDPDVVMVGEMRDRKTAELAIKLANTGHLTFSTLHTNDAPSAISRLYKMGIEPFLIAYAINLVVAQRLIRRVCPTCKQVDPDPDPVLLKQMGFEEDEIANGTFYILGEDDNCPTCKGVGYKGRRAICEALYFSRALRHLIVESEGNLDEGAIRDLAVKEGMLTLRDSAREYVKLGETTVLEMIRVTTTEE